MVVSTFGMPSCSSGIGERDVRRVLGHRLREAVVRDAREEEHARVGEVAAVVVLDVADRPLVEEPAQHRAGRHRHACHRRLEPGGRRVVEAARADERVVVAPCRGPRRRPRPAMRRDQVERLPHVVVGAEATEPERVADERGGVVVVGGARPETDADDLLHPRTRGRGATPPIIAPFEAGVRSCLATIFKTWPPRRGPGRAYFGSGQKPGANPRARSRRDSGSIRVTCGGRMPSRTNSGRNS